MLSQSLVNICSEAARAEDGADERTASVWVCLEAQTIGYNIMSLAGNHCDFNDCVFNKIQGE